jgi:hypothetical protein
MHRMKVSLVMENGFRSYTITSPHQSTYINRCLRIGAHPAGVSRTLQRSIPGAVSWEILENQDTMTFALILRFLDTQHEAKDEK